MDHARIEKVLKIILELANNHYSTVPALAQRYETTERTIYRYIETIREAGFVVKNDGKGVYTLDRTSPYIKEISELVYFSEEEAYILKEAIESVDENTLIKQNLKKKLYAVYDFKLMAKVVTNMRNQANMKALMEAIENRRQVIFHNYCSAHSNSCSDRIVEPFSFTTNFVQVWCYEPESQKVKQFKVSRIQSVEILDKEWANSSKHKTGFIDIFRMHSDKKYLIELKLSVRAANLLMEEYPLSKEYLKQLSDNRWVLKTDVCSFEGVGRFILGLYNDIEIIQSKQLKEFIRYKLEMMMAQ